jgi:hypothetical protein
MTTTRPMPAPEAHAPVLVRNTTGHGIATLLACSCGKAPAKGATRGSTQHVWQMRHRRTLGLDQSPAQWVYGPDAAAAGHTFDSWYAEAAGINPWTGEAE